MLGPRNSSAPGHPDSSLLQNQVQQCLGGKRVQKQGNPFHQHSSHCSDFALASLTFPLAGRGAGRGCGSRAGEEGPALSSHLSPSSGVTATRGTPLRAPAALCLAASPACQNQQGQKAPTAGPCPSSNHISLHRGSSGSPSIPEVRGEVSALENSSFPLPCFTLQLFPPTQPCCHFTFVLVHE